MRRLPLVPLLAPSLLALAACGPNPSDPGPGGVTVGEAKALDDAAAMLDARRGPPPPTPEQSATPTKEAPR